MPEQAENAIREYLEYVATGELPDRPQLAQLEADATGAEDIIGRVLATADLIKARPTPTGLRDAFVAAAKAWAEKHDVPPAAFAQMGVPTDVIQEVWPTRPKAPKAAVKRRTSYPRRDPDEIFAKISKISGPFTVTDAAKAADVSYPTATNVIKELFAQHRLEKVGMKPNDRGRASQLWQAVKAKK